MEGRATLLRKISFPGEDSARFTRFAIEAQKHLSSPIHVALEGREPITSRFINVKGKLHGALLDGYRRHVEIIEDETDLLYWAAGTNSTSATATSKLTFYLEQNEYDALCSICNEQQVFIPTMTIEAAFDEKWYFVDHANQHINTSTANRLIGLLEETENIDLLGEIALTLRSFADFLSLNLRLQKRCERKVIALLSAVTSEKARIPLVELIGYIGSEDSLPTLKGIMNDALEHAHVIWAAVIALGRISSKDSDNILISKINQTASSCEVASERSQVTDQDWIEAATLLCLARRTNKDLGSQLEPIYAKRLTCTNKILRRYACLGVSRLESVQDSTIDLLLTGLESTSSEVELGYYAMALVCAYNQPTCRALWSFDRISKLTEILSSKLSCFDDDCHEPDRIWGLEFLSELASTLENNELASKFHLNLSYLFEDWRSVYYQALSEYEKGEFSIRKNLDYNDVYDRFASARNLLNSVSIHGEYAESSISFRKDVIEARIALLEILEKWINSDDKGVLATEVQLRVISLYTKYSHGSNYGRSYLNRRSSFEQSAVNKTISKRESDCIQNTCDVLGIMKNIMFFHSKILQRGICAEAETSLQSIQQVVKSVYDRSDLSHNHRQIIEQLKNQISDMEYVFIGNDENRVKYTNILNVMDDIINLFKKSAWSMPAHVCLLSGLGRGDINIQDSSLNGKGQESNPYVFLTTSPIVINIVATIKEMVTGGATKACVICKPANTENLKQEKLLPIVEGSTTISFIVPQEVVSEYTPTRVDFSLAFVSNDIYQEGTPITVFIKKGDLQ